MRHEYGHEVTGRGFARATHLTSIDIRNGRLNRDVAAKLVKQYEGKRPASLDIFLKYAGITEEEFNSILIKQAISPYKHDFSKIETGKPVHDMGHWELLNSIDE